jgi:hypothetical protein
MSGPLELWYVWRVPCGYGCAEGDKGFGNCSCGHGKRSEGLAGIHIIKSNIKRGKRKKYILKDTISVNVTFTEHLLISYSLRFSPSIAFSGESRDI